MQNTKVWLMDERYNIVERSNINFVPVMRILWDIEKCEKKYPFLVGIDPYGDTYFNVHQSPIVIRELEILKHEKISEPVLKEIEGSIEFLKKVEQHTFAKFIGD